jgi:hypothetical protein
LTATCQRVNKSAPPIIVRGSERKACCEFNLSRKVGTPPVYAIGERKAEGFVISGTLRYHDANDPAFPGADGHVAGRARHEWVETNNSASNPCNSCGRACRAGYRGRCLPGQDHDGCTCWPRGHRHRSSLDPEHQQRGLTVQVSGAGRTNKSAPRIIVRSIAQYTRLAGAAGARVHAMSSTRAATLPSGLWIELRMATPMQATPAA